MTRTKAKYLREQQEKVEKELEKKNQEEMRGKQRRDAEQHGREAGGSETENEEKEEVYEECFECTRTNVRTSMGVKCHRCGIRKCNLCLKWPVQIFDSLQWRI